MPLLACPAVLTLDTDCWTSQQWHTFPCRSENLLVLFSSTRVGSHRLRPSPLKPFVTLGAQLLKELNRQGEAVELFERSLHLDSSADDLRRQLEELQKQ